jgi:hypothetical protein
VSVVSPSTRETVQRLMQQGERASIIANVAEPVTVAYLSRVLARLRRGGATPMQFHLVALVEVVCLAVRQILGPNASDASRSQTLSALALLLQVRAHETAHGVPEPWMPEQTQTPEQQP